MLLILRLGIFFYLSHTIILKNKDISAKYRYSAKYMKRISSSKPWIITSVHAREHAHTKKRKIAVFRKSLASPGMYPYRIDTFYTSLRIRNISNVVRIEFSFTLNKRFYYVQSRNYRVKYSFMSFSKERNRGNLIEKEGLKSKRN